MSRIILSRKVAFASIVALPLVAGGFMLQSRVVRGSQALLDQVLQLVNERYVDTLDAGQLYEKAARGLVKELNDPYSELLAPKELKAFTTNTGGHYGGIGMQIEPQQGQIVISKVFPNTPAEAAGVREGDRIVQIDTIHVVNWTTQQAQDQLMGTPGTKVTVKFARPGVANPIEVHFTRAVIHVPAVRYAISFTQNGDRIGYVPLDRFNETAALEVQEAVRSLQKQNVRGIVLDFRNNPGGILDQSLAISNLFLKDGQEIASIRARNGETQPYVAHGVPSLPTMPLIVLTDEYTASASEIVAGALQDHDRALIVGTTSFGKGLVQSVFPLDGGYFLKMTTGKWYTPSGRSIHRERQLLPDGRFVETHPDSLETDSARKTRPKFQSDAGRTVYGGGGITPDVIVTDDTLSTVEQQFLRSIAPKGQIVQSALESYAFELKGTVKRDFVLSPSWTSELTRRVAQRGVTIEPRFQDAADRLLSRELEHRVARMAFGDAAAKEREVRTDRQLSRAMDLLEKAGSQRELFTVAHAEVGARH